MITMGKLIVKYGLNGAGINKNILNMFLNSNLINYQLCQHVRHTRHKVIAKKFNMDWKILLWVVFIQV